MRRLILLAATPLLLTACGSEDLSLEGAVKDAREKQASDARELRDRARVYEQRRLRERAELESASAEARRDRRRALRAASP